MRVFLYILESILCSGLLLAFYQLLLARKVSYRFCRGWLLAAALLAVAIPAFRLPLIPTDSSAATLLNVVESTKLSVKTTDTEWMAQPPKPDMDASLPLATQILLGVYVAVALVLMGLTLSRILHIRRLRRDSSLTKTPAYTLAENAAVHSPFSFGQTLFIGPDLEPEDREMVVAHEASHIAHHHTTEKLLLKLIRSLFWFNPFLWLSERWLVEVQEYEADADVLREGYGLQEYRYAIFRQLFGHEPDISSAMGHSLTRKRFERMDNDPREGRLSLRLAAACLLVGGLFLAFGTAAKPRFIPYAHEREGIGLLDEVVFTRYATSHPRQAARKTSQLESVRLLEGVTPWSELPVKPIFSQNITTWVQKNLSWPENCLQQGTVEVSFTVDEEGRIDNVALVSGVCEELDQAVLQLVKDHFPMTLPAISKDTSFVSSQCILPVTFQIRGPLAARWEKGVASIQEIWMPVPLKEADGKPLFKADGDANDFSRWVQSQLTYSEEVRDWCRENGKRGSLILCQFTLSKRGRVKDVKVLQGVGFPPMEKQIRQIVRNAPRWEQPATRDGHPVAVRYNLPVFLKVPID